MTRRIAIMAPPERQPHLLAALAREPGTTMRCSFTEAARRRRGRARR
jgi:hypothetical protein